MNWRLILALALNAAGWIGVVKLACHVRITGLALDRGDIALTLAILTFSTWLALRAARL